MPTISLNGNLSSFQLSRMQESDLSIIIESEQERNGKELKKVKIPQFGAASAAEDNQPLRLNRSTNPGIKSEKNLTPNIERGKL